MQKAKRRQSSLKGLFQKPMVIRRKQSHSEAEEEELEDHEANSSLALQLPLKKRLYPRAAIVAKKKTKTRRLSDSDTTPVKQLSMEMKNLIESWKVPI